ncbi:MAG: AAA family ATPase [Cyanobacteria bacterium RU_5_0]|nr:AAA family ATPase [Cyanobacteria bacterium RU_5_0]
MAVSLRASEQGLKIVDQLRRKKGWSVTAASWCDAARTSVATLKRFRGRLPIQQDAFISICKAVGIKNWEEIVDKSPTSETASYIEFLVYKDDEWVGRESLTEELSNRLRGSCRILLLVGITGVGKTALAERLVDKLRGNWIESRENFENKNKALDFGSVAAEWLTKWGETVPQDQRTSQQLLQRLIKHLREHQHLILMDSLECLLKGNEEDGWGDFVDEWWGKFFFSLLSEASCKSRLILTSQDFPAQLERECDRYNNLHSQLIKGLETPEQIAFFQKAELDGNLESPHSPLRLIGEVYDGHPLALRVIAGEIKTSWQRNVQAYWNENRRGIEEVKESLEQARQQGIVKGEADRWKLDSYTNALRQIVKERLEKTLERLKKDVYEAYFLLCTASVYRCEVKEKWWLSNLEDEGYSEEQQKAAVQALRDRYLIEEGGIDHEFERLVEQHNLIRSVAIDHRLKLPEN